MIITADHNVGDGTLKCDMPPGWAPDAAAGYRVRPGAHEFVRLDDFLCAHDVGDIMFAKLDVEARRARAPALALIPACACELIYSICGFLIAQSCPRRLGDTARVSFCEYLSQLI